MLADHLVLVGVRRKEGLSGCKQSLVRPVRGEPLAVTLLAVHGIAILLLGREDLVALLNRHVLEAGGLHEPQVGRIASGELGVLSDGLDRARQRSPGTLPLLVLGLSLRGAEDAAESWAENRG